MRAPLDLVRVQSFVNRWAGRSGGERATKDLFCIELVEALGLERPTPGKEGWAGEYGFEVDSLRVGKGGKARLGKIDFLKPDAFLLEAKMGSRDLALRGDDLEAESVAAGYTGVKAEEVRDVLEALAVMGVVVGFEDEAGGGTRWRAVRGAA